MAKEFDSNAKSGSQKVDSRGMTYEEFLERSGEYVWAEWVNGEVLEMTPASDRHQDLASFLTALLRLFAEAHNLGHVRPAPFQMKTGPDLPGREPDILFLADKHRSRLRQHHLEGPADLVVEIVSPDSRARDRGEKLYEYEQGGVREYWLIDPILKEAELYSLSDEGSYVLQPPTKGGRLKSEVMPGLWFRMDWLFSEPLPPILSILKEWKLV